MGTQFPFNDGSSGKESELNYSHDKTNIAYKPSCESDKQLFSPSDRDYKSSVED